MGLPQQLASCPGVVWDFDGVIADTEPCQQRAYEVVCAELDVELEVGWFGRWVGTPEPQIWAGLAAEHQLRPDIESLRRRRSEVYLDIAAALRPAWYVPEVLDLPVGHRIVSSGNHEQIESLLRLWGLREAFSTISASDSPHTLAGEPKAKRLEVALRPGFVLFEDVRQYLNVGAACGAITVAVGHSLNDLAPGAGDLYVDHAVPGHWLST